MLLLLGTSLGAAAVFVLKGELKKSISRALEGFAAGVMVAASVWSLLIPAIEGSNAFGRLAFLPAAAGLWLGFAFLMLIEHFAKRLEGGAPDKNKMMIFVVTLHNIPRGDGGWRCICGAESGQPRNYRGCGAYPCGGNCNSEYTRGGNNFNAAEGRGQKQEQSVFNGCAIRAVEPIAGGLTVILAGLIAPLMPIFLSFAAGAMLYVVIEELIPECATSSDCTQEQYFLQ